jgi:hypothetical protein
MQAYQQAMAQWTQAAQAAQQVVQANQQKQQQFDAAVALLKQDGIHGFRIDIEADSTIAPDENAEKEARTDFMEKFVPFLEQIVPIAQGNPAAAEMGEEMALFVMRGFRVARPLEEAVTKFFDTIAKMPPPPQKGAKADGPDSPADLALRSKEDTTKLTIARENNAVKIAELGAKTHQASAQMAADHMKDIAHAGMEATRIANEHQLQTARSDMLQSREAKNLS